MARAEVRPVPLGTSPSTGLLAAYLEESGLEVGQVLTVMPLLDHPEMPHALGRLTADERAELNMISDTVERAWWWVKDARRTRSLAQDETLEAWIPATERRAVLEAVLALPPLEATVPTRDGGPNATNEENAAGIRALAEHSATFRAAHARREELYRKCILTPAQHKARVTKLLTRADGTRAISPPEWCAKYGQDLTAFRADLYFTGIEALRAELARPTVGGKRTPIRQGTAFLQSVTATNRTVEDARRKRRDGLTEQERDARKLFRYEPLGWAEMVVITALANQAREEGKLEGHESATAPKRLVSGTNAVDAPRVALDFHGFASLARQCGAKPGPDGRIPKNLRKSLEAALRNLTQTPRWIAEPVLVQHGKKWVDDVRVTQTLWVESSVLAGSGETRLLLHPVAVASMLTSFVERGENLLEQYDTARKAIGVDQMRDDFVQCETYLLRLASTKAQAARLALEKAPEGTTEGSRVLTAEVGRTKLWEQMRWDVIAKKKGRRVAEQRERDALAFCRERGVLIEWHEREGKKEQVLVLTLRHPDARGQDPAQGVLFLGSGSL